MSPTMLVGAAFLFAGGLLFLALLFGSGGANRSAQLAVLGQLFSGALGSARRTLGFVAVAMLGVGTCTTFASVASKDAARARRCREHCVAEGYEEGKIGPSLDRDPARRFVACTCSGGRDEPLEVRADSLR